MKNVLVLGCAGSAGLNFVKAVQHAGDDIRIVGVELNEYFVELSTADRKYLLEREQTPEGVRGYIEDINRIIEREDIDFVHAQPDPEVAILSTNRDRVNAATFLPSRDAIVTSHDKWLTYEAMINAGVNVPKTVAINDREDLEEQVKKAFDEISGPVWVRASSGAGGKASLLAESYLRAKVWIDQWVASGLKQEDFILSEYLPGREVSWLSLWRDGKLVCSQGKERLGWMKVGTTASGVTGTTAIQRTVHYEDVNKVCTGAVLAVDRKPQGIYVVDVKQDADDGYAVMEINPGRFFTTSLFFPHCGVNFPRIYLRLANGEDVEGLSPHNSVEEGYYWIRTPDGGPVLRKPGQKWNAIRLEP